MLSFMSSHWVKPLVAGPTYNMPSSALVPMITSTSELNFSESSNSSTLPGRNGSEVKSLSGTPCQGEPHSKAMLKNSSTSLL